MAGPLSRPFILLRDSRNGRLDDSMKSVACTVPSSRLSAFGLGRNDTPLVGCRLWYWRTGHETPTFHHSRKGTRPPPRAREPKYEPRTNRHSAGGLDRAVYGDRLPD